MTEYGFRIRFYKSDSDSIQTDSTSITIDIPNQDNSIVLESYRKDDKLKKSGEWVVKGYGWESEEEAIKQGQKCLNALYLTFVKLRLGTNFGSRKPQGYLAKGFLKDIEKSSGRRVINDKLGLMTYELNPRPLLSRLGSVSMSRNVNQEDFKNELQKNLKDPPTITEKVQLAIDIFSASFFQKSADVRLLLLVMSIESLIEQKKRPQRAIEHIEYLIEITEDSEEIETYDKTSIKGSLKQLKQKSIRQATKDLANEYLTDKMYKEMDAFKFIDECYSARSNLVHGNIPYPSIQKVGSLVGQLELLVSDLITSIVYNK